MRWSRGAFLLLLLLLGLAVGSLTAAAADSIAPIYQTGLEFNGKNTYVELQYPFAAVPNTFEFWVKVPTTVPDKTRVGILIGSYVSGAEPNNPTNIEIHTTGRLRAYWNKGNPDWYGRGFDARTGEWFHYSVVRDETGAAGSVGFRIYVNGELLDSSTPLGANVIPRDAAKIGGDGRAPGGPIFNGRIGEVRVWATARTQEEIRQGMHNNLSGSEPSLLGYWKMDEGQGDVIIDHSPYKNHGRIIGATWYTEHAQNVALDFAPLQYNHAAQSAQGSVQIATEDSIQGLNLQIQAQISEMVWDREKRIYNEVPYGATTVLAQTLDLQPGSTELALSIKSPDRLGLWQVTYSASVGDKIGLQTTNVTQQFHNYPPMPVTQAGEPYAIAVFPDTQHFADKYPHIFTRMTEWLVKNAAERNIRLMLHMGDITNHNKQGLIGAGTTKRKRSS